MELVLQKLSYLMSSAKVYFEKTDVVVFEAKPVPEKWSKKEILGHLIDSAINNIQRFTEIQNSEKPYQVRSYNPDALVIANHYQEKDIEELLLLWLQLNLQVKFIIRNFTKEIISFPLILPNGETKDLKFLVNDYADHLEHHLDLIYH